MLICIGSYENTTGTQDKSKDISPSFSGNDIFIAAAPHNAAIYMPPGRGRYDSSAGRNGRIGRMRGQGRRRGWNQGAEIGKCGKIGASYAAHIQRGGVKTRLGF